MGGGSKWVFWNQLPVFLYELVVTPKSIQPTQNLVAVHLSVQVCTIVVIHECIPYSFPIKYIYAVYKAVGLCAFQLYDDVNFDSWYQTQLQLYYCSNVITLQR